MTALPSYPRFMGTDAISLLQPPRVVPRRMYVKVPASRGTEKSGANPRILKHELVSRFITLSSRWKETRQKGADIEALIDNESYRAIVSMGVAVVPLIVEEMRNDADFWFMAMSDITGADPVNPEDYGKLLKVTEAWITWWESGATDS